MLELHEVSLRYGRIRALDRVSLKLEAGTVGLVGNNGAGKSSLLKILLGLLRPDSGGGTILGCDLRQAAGRLRGRVGYMAESLATVPVLKGVEFVTLSGDLYGMPHRDARRRAHETLEYVGLGELRYRRLEEYSTGNLQRLKLASALVHDPELLLLDEPTNGLDPQGRRSMLRLIGDLIRETGKSVILCTHLLGEVERICEQVVLLDGGRVAGAGSVEQLRARQPGRYTLAWQGPDESWLAALRAAGATVTPQPVGGRISVAVGEDWDARRLFALARQAGVVLTELAPEEEDLERVFLRMTRLPTLTLAEDG